jgi:hypothetical protein
MHDQHLECPVAPAIEQRARGDFQNSPPGSLSSGPMPIWLT